MIGGATNSPKKRSDDCQMHGLGRRRDEEKSHDGKAGGGWGKEARMRAKSPCAVRSPSPAPPRSLRAERQGNRQCRIFATSLSASPKPLWPVAGQAACRFAVGTPDQRTPQGVPLFAAVCNLLTVRAFCADLEHLQLTPGVQSNSPVICRSTEALAGSFTGTAASVTEMRRGVPSIDALLPPLFLLAAEALQAAIRPWDREDGPSSSRSGWADRDRVSGRNRKACRASRHRFERFYRSEARNKTIAC